MGEQKAHEHAAIHGASFKGMRHDLARWLDEVGMHEVASLDSCSELFGPKGEEVLHTTSAIRYPTFKHEHGGSWTNYSGSSPNLLDHRLLRSMVEKILAVELRQLDRAIVVPVGKAANRAVEHLCGIGVLDPARCLLGLPHPSGASPHRERYFEAAKGSLRRQVQDMPIFAGVRPPSPAFP